MSYFGRVLYSLLFVVEIYASWIRLTGPEFFNGTSNLSVEDKKPTANADWIRQDVFTQMTPLVSATTNFPPLNAKNNITVNLYEPKNKLNTKSRPLSDTDDFSISTFINRQSTTTKRGLYTTNNGIRNEIEAGGLSFQNGTVHGDKKLLDLIDKLADKVMINTKKEEQNLIYSSYITFVAENTRSIIWQEDRMNGPEITLLARAVRQLPTHSAVKIVNFRKKPQYKFLGDIVVMKTESIEQHSLHNILQIKFEKKYLSYPHGKWKCAYWDYQNSTWRDTEITTRLESKFVICLSTHLSAFSILLDPYNILYDHEDWHSFQDDFWLTNISVTGSWITICFVILVIIIHYRKVKDDQKNCRKKGQETSKILIHSSFALLVTHASYQVYTFLEKYLTCLVINAFTHYFVLAFLLWTAADGINMWRILFTNIFNTNGDVFYRWYKIICWGVPLINTGIGIFVTESHPYRKCRLQFHKTYDLFFYLVPCVLIFCCNLLLFTYIFVKMTCENRLGRLKDKKINHVLALTQVFGIGWCATFPFLCFPSTHLLGEYLFAAVVSTQGILIFVVRCGGDKSLRRKLRNSFRSKLSSSSVSTWFRGMSKSSTGHASPTPQKNISTKPETKTRRN